MEKVTRFRQGADQYAKQAFARDLMAALDRLGIDPGADFFIASPQASLLDPPQNGAKPELESAPTSLSMERVREWGETMTLAKAREVLGAGLDEGVECPVCDQYARIYRRKVHATMAKALIMMWRQGGADWFHLPSIETPRSRDETFLRYWSLIEEESERRPDGGRSGWWRVTETGVAFIEMRATVSKYARIYDGKLLGFEGEPVGIRDALGDRFSYDDLMRGA